jgi:hypothetical protein
MHLVIYFCGTRSNDAESFLEGYDYVQNPNVQTIFVRGCDDPEACNSQVFPNLKKFAARFCHKLFKGFKKETPLTLSQADLTSLGIGIGEKFNAKVYRDNIVTGHKEYNLNEKFGVKHVDTHSVIESITLCGYSRGAVTCFEVAKQLNAINPHIPVDIIANQPVPGNFYQGPGTNAASVADCRHLKNLRNVTVILGAYTADTEKTVRHVVHRGFFSQILPKLPRRANRHLVVIPKESHLKMQSNAPSGHNHVHMHTARTLKNKDGRWVSDEALDAKKAAAASGYQSEEPAKFPSPARLQSIFGLNTKQIYRHTDKLYPAAKSFKDYVFHPNEELINWWNRNDKSYFPSKLTKQLIEWIKVTNLDDIDSLKTLFEKADKWLIIKEGSNSPRYYQVESLRNHIYHELIQRGVKESELYAINRNTLNEMNFFLRHWTFESEAASYFKTDATRTLDTVFEAHTKIDPPTKEADKTLMAALDTWLDIKETSRSKRYDLVISIRERLEEIIENTDYDHALIHASRPIRPH